MKRVHVAAAVVRNAAGEILIARRAPDKHQGGLWEFPGGKVELGEAVEVALARELDEELGIQPRTSRPLIQISHDYPDKQVLLDVWMVDAFHGQAHGREHQPLRWVRPDDLLAFDFPAANRPIVTAVRLPERYLITPDPHEVVDMVAWLEERLRVGIRLVQWRAKQCDRADYIAIGRDLSAVCNAFGSKLMLNGEPELLEQIPADGLHLPARLLSQYSQRPVGDAQCLAASVHNVIELKQAEALGADFACLSPVADTGSHPDARPLGWDAFRELCAKAVIPVYALGGMRDSDVLRAWQCGAQGVAGIRAVGLKGTGH